MAALARDNAPAQHQPLRRRLFGFFKHQRRRFQTPTYRQSGKRK